MGCIAQIGDMAPVYFNLLFKFKWKQFYTSVTVNDN